MKFETRSGCKLLSISLCDEREYLGVSLRNRSFGAVARIRLDAMSGPIGKLIGRPSENATATLSGRSVFTPVVYTELKKRLRVEEVIARINTNVSLLERCNR